MRITLKQKLKFGKDVLEKGSVGRVIAVSNSEAMKKEFPCFVEGNGYFYIVEFAGFPEFLIDKSKLDGVE